MSPRQAKRILEMLAQGVDPTTGEVAPSDSPLNSAQVIRALFLGARALETFRTEETSEPNQASKAGKPWTREEDMRLIAAFDARVSIEKLAETHGRSKGGIAARLVRLGKIEERADVYSREPGRPGQGAEQPSPNRRET